MAKSFSLASQSLLVIALFALASCGVRPDSDSDTPAVTAPLVDNTGSSGSPTTVVGETPSTTPVVTAPAGPTAPTTPETPSSPSTPVVVLPTPTNPTTPDTGTTPPVVVSPTEPTTPVVTQPAASTSWAIVNAQFFAPNCARCHGAAGGVSLETYESAKNYLAEIRQAVLVDKSMPPRKTLPTATTDILKAWLDAGAPQ